MEIISKVFSMLMSFVLMLAPALSGISHPFSAESENAELFVSLISDTHIDYRDILLQGTLSGGLNGLNSSKTPIDAVVFAGDLTNYGDEKSVEKFYELVKKYAPSTAAFVVASGNHDIGHVEDVSQEEARQYLISNYNKLTGENTEKIYYSTTVNGYKFIVLSDEGEKTWDWPEISEEQLNFLEKELTEANGEPVFVCCHWPINGTNGQSVIWKDGGMADDSDAVRAVLERHKNVVYISGHMHSGVNSEIIEQTLGFRYVEKTNGVIYCNLPTFGLVNRYGIPWSAISVIMEVNNNEIRFRPRNLITGSWYVPYAVTVQFDK